MLTGALDNKALSQTLKNEITTKHKKKRKTNPTINKILGIVIAKNENGEDTVIVIEV